ncbi:nitroreductase family protein, partial [Leptospira santarosai]|nr:nitroreductase family protein [Leptospira santarosai]
MNQLQNKQFQFNKQLNQGTVFANSFSNRFTSKILKTFLSLSVYPPSAWNLQPWRFHVVTDVDLKKKLEEAAYGQKQVTSAPAVIVV